MTAMKQRDGILIVDDDKDACETLERLVTDLTGARDRERTAAARLNAAACTAPAR